MPLFARSRTTAAEPIPGTGVILPASSSLGTPGPRVDVTSELRGLTSAQYQDIDNALRQGKFKLDWSGDPEFDIGVLAGAAEADIETVDVQQRSQLAILDRLIAQERQKGACLASAANGDMALSLAPAGPLSLTAVELNAAAAGKLRQFVCVHFHDSDNKNHLWSDFDLVITPGESVVDVDVGVPTIEPATVRMKAGRAEFFLVYDTDAGATKTYAAADSVSVTVQVSAGDTWMGFTVTPQVLTIDVT